VPGVNISRAEAAERSAHLKVEKYQVTLDVTRGNETFYAKSVVTFSCNKPGYDTFIDAVGKSIISATLNGAPVDTSNFDGESVFIKNLAAQNELIIEIEAEYSKVGEGLQLSVDPADNEVYLYSQGETAYNRRMFPCFDQPDLKAVFELTATAPAHWEVISNSNVKNVSEADGKKTWSFLPTPIIPTYIAVLVAGPYKHVHKDYVGSKTIPMGIYARKSLFEHVDAENIFKITEQGFDYFEKVFGLAYPFEKYDQIAVVDFNWGAMENSGAVTWREEMFIFRSKVTERQYNFRASTILHEMAHMWFGNMATMKWWDDLWLNESFAEWAAHHCSANATKYTEAWTTFVNQRKAWGYRQDQLPTTHPIVADMVDLDAVEVNFDGITYAKGASALRQLVAWVGEDAFFEGVREYFKKHSWGNTELTDLLTELEKSSGRDLSDWTVRWLQTAGVNTLRPEVVITDGKYASVTVLQEPPVAPEGVAQTLRPHRIRIGLYNDVDGRIGLTDSVEIDVDGARTDVPELIGKPAAALLLLNDGDFTFTKIRLDEHSAKSAIVHLDKIDDSLASALVWASAWDMTRDGEMPTHGYLTMVLNEKIVDREIGVAQQLLLQARSAIEQFGNPTKRAEYRDALVDSLRKQLPLAEAGGDHQLAFVRNIAGLARTDEHIALVTDWLNNQNLPAGLVVDTDLRWSFVARLVALGALPESAIDEELTRDNTAGGQRQAAAARAGVPTAEAKERAWHAAIDNDDLPNAILDNTVGGFAQVDQRELLVPYIDKYFAVLPEIWKTRTNETAQTITRGFFPSLLESQEVLDKADAFLATDTDAGSTRMVRELRDGVARSLKCQAADK